MYRLHIEPRGKFTSMYHSDYFSNREILDQLFIQNFTVINCSASGSPGHRNGGTQAVWQTGLVFVKNSFSSLAHSLPRSFLSQILGFATDYFSSVIEQFTLQTHVKIKLTGILELWFTPNACNRTLVSGLSSKNMSHVVWSIDEWITLNKILIIFPKIATQCDWTGLSRLFVFHHWFRVLHNTC